MENVNALFAVEDAPELLTEQILRRYATSVAHSQQEREGANIQNITMRQGSSSNINSNGNSIKALQSSESPTQALAPLEILYGKTFLSAIAIVMHKAENITRVVEMTPSNEHTGRELYRIGEHTLLSPYYCPCAAYSLQSIRRQETWCCKHLLALQIVRALLDAGANVDSLHTQILDSDAFQEMLLASINECIR